MSWLLLTVVLGLPLSPPAEDTSPYRVIVPKGSSLSEVSRAELQRIYMRRMKSWEDGTAIHPVDLSGTSLVRATFSKAVLGQTVGEVQNAWMKVMLAGNDVPPPVRDTEAEVIAYVSGTAGAIGYVSSDVPLPASVKTVRVTEG